MTRYVNVDVHIINTQHVVVYTHRVQNVNTFTPKAARAHISFGFLWPPLYAPCAHTVLCIHEHIAHSFIGRTSDFFVAKQASELASVHIVCEHTNSFLFSALLCLLRN